MNKIIHMAWACMFLAFEGNSQNKVGIGNTSPQSELDVTGKTRSTSFQMTSGAALGNLLRSDAAGNASWVMPSTILSNEWHATGNTGTIPGTHFIGTIDNVNLTFRVNNQHSGLIDFVNGNTNFGYLAGSGNATGVHNTAVGSDALRYNTSNHNTGIGSGVLKNNTTARYNSALGSEALYLNTTGENNVAVGFEALYYNTAGNYNSALGSEALIFNTTGELNAAVGFRTLWGNTTGNYNSALGSFALASNTTGNDNAAVGIDALGSNTTGIYNSALGSLALWHNTAGGYNVAVGHKALAGNTTADYNSALGSHALLNNTTGEYNVAVGYDALWTNGTGAYNLAIGSQALLSNVVGNENTVVGFGAGWSNVSGSGNVFIGHLAGYNETGSDKLYIANTINNPPLIYGLFPSNGIGIGTTAIAGESKLALGSMFEADEGGQLQLNPGSSWADAYFVDVYQNNFRIMKGTTSGSSVVRLLINTSGNIGLGTNPVNKLDVEGGVAIGSGYSGASSGPADGAIIEGSVGIGTASPATKLEVAGTTRTNGLQVSNAGTVFNRVQGGTAALGSGVAGVNVYTINFPNAFTVAPKIMVTPRGENYTDTFSVTTKNITTTSFQVNVQRTDTNTPWGQNLQIDWFAWE